MRWIDWTGLECAGCLAEGSDGDGLTGRLVIGANDYTIGEAGEALSVRLVSFVGAGANALAGISTRRQRTNSLHPQNHYKGTTQGL